MSMRILISRVRTKCCLESASMVLYGASVKFASPAYEIGSFVCFSLKNDIVLLINEGKDIASIS